ncbi:MAG: protein kinase [Lachnospiraceae bacterium]|nr:protein kinase [Lachnospiraceae bacterium]
MQGLELCKQHQIIHRDIKPENIFRSESGMFKLGDFGIARIAEKTSGASTRAGTAAFMAPEIHRGERYTDRVDIYSLGLVLYRLTNGNRLPFLPQAPAPITFIAKEEAQSRRLGGEALPAPAAAGKELAEVILRATAFRPEDRYGSAEEMRKALEALETPETLQTVTDAEGDRYDHTEMLFSGPDQKQTGKQEEASGDDATELLIASPGKPEGDSAEGAGQPVMVYETSRFAKIKAASEKEPAGAKKKESNRPLMIGIGIAGLAAAVLIILLATGVFSSGSQTGATDAAAVAGTDVSASVSDTDVSEASESAVSEASESAVSEASESAVSETAGSAVSEAAGSTASEEETFISDETDMVFITDIEDCTATATVTVRIRKNPETDADILSDLKAGTRVTVVARASRSNGQIWYKVCYDNNDPSRTGFVIADFLTLDP